MISEIFVVDNSIVMSWCFNDEANDYADRVLDRLAAGAAFVPSIWPLEVVNVLLVAERKKRLETFDCVRFLRFLEQLPITVEYGQGEVRMKELLSLARSNRLSSYDAAYLDLAMRKGVPIATLDNALAKAAKKTGIAILTA